MFRDDFYTGCYLPSNGTIVNFVLHDLDLHFQDQTFSCNALVIKYVQVADGQQICLDSHGPRRGVALLLLINTPPPG